MPSLTVGVGGQSIGNPPIGPLSPGWEAVYNLIRGERINLRAEPWTEKMLFHRPIGHMPNAAPAGLQYRASRLGIQAPKRNRNAANAPNFGSFWAGVGG